MTQVNRLYSFFASLALLFTIIVSSCSMQVGDEPKRARKTVEYGSLTITGDKSDSRALDVTQMGFAKVFVTGKGITSAVTSDFIEMKDGTGSLSNVTVADIPVGNNRIVTVQAYDSSKNPITGAVIRNIVDIKGGTEPNACTVNQASTPLGNVFVKLNSLTDISEIDSASLKAFFDGNNISWSLIDTDAIALAYISDSTLNGKKVSDFKKATGTVNLTLSGLTQNYELRISDPSSKSVTLTSANLSSSIIDAAPGKWSVVAFSGNQVIARNNNVIVQEGKTTTINVTESNEGAVSGKTIIFVKADSAPNIWAWETDGGVALSTGLGESWDNASGSVMSAATTEYMADPSGWYMKDFTSKTNGTALASGKAINFKLNRCGDDGIVTGLAGTFWYDGSSCSAANPSPATSGSKTITFTVTNPNGSECIKVHGKYTHIWAWETGNESNNYTGGKWPGVAMTEEADGWYTYTLDYPTADVILHTGDNDRSKPDGQGGDTLTTGEWWFDKTNKKWCDSNPDDNVAPELVSFTADKTGTVSGDVVLTVSATDNLSLSKAVITSGTSTIGTITLSGKSAEETYTWETARLQNGSYTLTATVYDGAGNVSESANLSFTTNNENLPPIAKISGSTKVRVGKSITYYASSSYDQNGGTIASYKWTVTGATATSGLNEENLTITAPSSVGANFTVTLVVTDNDGASSETVSMDCTTIDVDPNWDFRDETIYFLMTTRFYDGDSSNNRYCWGDQQFLWSEDNNDPGWRGDFKGLIEKLDYIKALGFTAIWITPVVENASDLDYHGYHATDFSKVDPRYESTGVTYQTLIDACHNKGLKVIQDIVLNHCSNAGERNILPMTVKDYNGDVRVYNGVKYSVPMAPDHNATDIYGRNTYTLLNQGVKALTGGKYNTYEELEADANGYYNNDTRGSLLYQSRIYSMNNGLAIDNEEVGKMFHYCPNFDQWESYDVQEGTMAGDCVDLNTENPKVAEYLRNCYIKYINMGVDAFRIDTLKHISRLTMNNEFIPQFHEAARATGNDNFFMFGEACVKRCDIFNAGLPGISVCFYTWNQNAEKLDSAYPWKDVSDYIAGAKDNLAQCKTHFNAQTTSNQLTSDNAFLEGLEYHAPDYSKYSGLSVIDFRMHHQFLNANQAYSCCIEEDQYFNDSTWNVTYVDSHDYGPNTILGVRYDQGTDAWAENLDLMFTFRGIPCIYYGSEIEFQKGEQIEPWFNGNRVPYNKSGRAYFGDHLEGSVTANDTGDYTASGAIKETLDSTLSQHIMRLNQIRAAVPALRKGQYKSYGSMKFVRRYTANGIDSVAVVSISDSGSFSGLPAGKYIDVVSGDIQNIGQGGTITTKNSGKASMSVYVNATLDSSITGPIGNAGVYLK